MRKILPAVAVVLSIAVLSSCGNPTPQARVAATVNGSALSVDDLRAAMSQASGAKPGAVLDGLVDQELLAQKALKNRLDTYPEVDQALRAARRQILAQAYIRQLIASASGDDKRAIRAYYQQHPRLFAQRRSYRLFELGLNTTAVDVDKLKEKVSASRHLSDVADWLRARNVAFYLGANTKLPEQIPEAFLPKLAAMQDGDMQVWQAGERVSVIQLVQSESVPLSEDDALPMIEKYLLANNRLEALTTTLKSLRERAAIDYVIDFDGSHPKKDVEAEPIAPPPIF
jgi:EpsD family peptidyl-prolyl cis-trans isomerase